MTASRSRKDFTRARATAELSAMGLPTSTEALDPISPQYLHDIITWSAIGARTTESQTHREMSSGLSSPVGFQNGTDGGLEVAINAMKAVSSPHRFLGIDPKAKSALFHTQGQSLCPCRSTWRQWYAELRFSQYCPVRREMRSRWSLQQYHDRLQPREFKQGSQP